MTKLTAAAGGIVTQADALPLSASHVATPQVARAPVKMPTVGQANSGTCSPGSGRAWRAAGGAGARVVATRPTLVLLSGAGNQRHPSVGVPPLDPRRVATDPATPHH